MVLKSKLDFGKKDLLIMLAILLFTLFVRGLYFVDFKQVYFYPLLAQSDGHDYYFWAKDIASGNLIGQGVFMKWPLYPYVLASLLKFFQGRITSVYFFQMLLGIINCILIYIIAKILTNRFVAALAAIFFASYALLIFYENLLLYVTLSLFLNLLFFLLLLLLPGRIRYSKMLFLGAFLGMCTLLQANIIIFGIFATACILVSEFSFSKKCVRYFFCFLAGLSIIVGLTTFRNYLVGKDFVLLSGNVGLNFYLGNNPQTDGTYRCPSFLSPTQEEMYRNARNIANSASGRNLKASEVSRFWFDKAFMFIKSHPVAYLRLLQNKINYLFSPGEFVADQEYHLIYSKVRAFRFLFTDLWFILPFAVLGALLMVKNLKDNALLYIYGATFSLSIMIFFVISRYRIVLMPVFSIFAAYTIFWIWKSLREGKYKIFGILICASAALFYLIDYPYFLSKKFANYDEFFDIHLSKACAFINNNENENALKILQADRGASTAPLHHLAFLKGVAYYQSGNIKQAETQFLEAIQRFPLYSDAYYNLGLIYTRQKKYTEAIRVLKKAISLNSEAAEFYFELGMAYRLLGESQLAKEEFLQSLKRLKPWQKEDRAIIERELATLS